MEERWCDLVCIPVLRLQFPHQKFQWTRYLANTCVFFYQPRCRRWSLLDFTMSFLLFSDSECLFTDIVSEILDDEPTDVGGFGSCLESSLILFVFVGQHILRCFRITTTVFFGFGTCYYHFSCGLTWRWRFFLVILWRCLNFWFPFTRFF